MQVIYKYKILMVFAAVIGQSFLFSLAYTAWKGQGRTVQPPEYKFHENKAILNEDEKHWSQSDTLKIRSIDNTEQNTDLMHKENIRIIF